jgi:alpha-ketoglutarate-dependent taurine dioxygenase
LEDVDLVSWVESSRPRIEDWRKRHGALLFRGFGLRSVEEFERLAEAICPTLFAEYGDLPKEEDGEKVYHSTPYPEDKTILFHNESSHTHRWPLQQFFFSQIAAQEGGETPIVDCRKIYDRLPPEIRDPFERLGLLYVRNFTEGLDVSWQAFFKTSKREQVERFCAEAGIDYEWTDKGLRTRQRAPAVTTHPTTGEKLFFNQIQLHHVSCLDPEMRASLESVFGLEDLPRNVYYGDGSVIEDETVQAILDLYWQEAVSFPWQEGDVLMVDNMLTAHARNPFRGPRKIVVAMGDLFYGSRAAAGEPVA